MCIRDRLGVEVRLETIDGQPVFRIDVPLAIPGPVATKDGFYTKRVLDTLGHPSACPCLRKRSSAWE